MARTNRRLEFANGSRVLSLPGTERTVRGFSEVSLLVIDEAARVDDGLYYAVRPMLAVSGGRLVALSTPYGKRGWFHDEGLGNSTGPQGLREAGPLNRWKQRRRKPLIAWSAK